MQSLDKRLWVQGSAALAGALIAFVISLPLAGFGFACLVAILGGVFGLMAVSVLWENHETPTQPPDRWRSPSGAP